MINPQPEYILLQEVKEEKSTKSSILLSEDADIEPPNLAKVIKIGSVADFKEGDTVLFKRHLFDDINFDDIHYLIGKQEGIVATITND